MLINTFVINEQVKLNNISLDFSKYGIYLVKGRNGSGKSSLIKQIVFSDKNTIDFNTVEHEGKYNSDRGDLISYIEQDPVAYKCSIRQYIYKSTTIKDEIALLEYLNKFQLSYLKLNDNIEKLSGGELVKINIIAALMKKTPYVFMDEPTNNMDNESVRLLVNILKNLSLEKSFIIVSHDPRLNFEDYSSVIIDDKVTQQPFSNHSLNNNTTTKLGFPKLKLIKEFFLSAYSVLSYIIICSILALILFTNIFIYHRYISVDDIVDTKDIIVSYKVDQEYNELNKNYVKNEKIDIDKSKEYQMIYFNDLYEIGQNKDIEKIILPNMKYIDNISDVLDEAYNEQKLPESLIMLAVPNEIIANFGGQIYLPCDVRMLKKGRLPDDNKKEVVISEGLLEKFFSLNDSNSIGKSIVINNESYKIVGIGMHDLCLLSYSDETDFGYFKFNPISAKVKFEELKSYFIEADYYLKDSVFNTLIYTKKGSEQGVLNNLITNYPAENYRSYQFEKGYKEIVNKKGVSLLVVFNILISVVTSLIIVGTLKQILKYFEYKAVSFNNYYCSINLLHKLHKRYAMLNYIVIFALVIVITFIKYNYVLPYLLINLILFLFFYVAFIYGRRKNDYN